MTHGPTRRRLAAWLLLGLTVLHPPSWAGPAATGDGLEILRSVPFQPQLPAGSKWRHPVSGTRVDLVLKPTPAARARVWLDGLPVSQHPEVRRHGPLPDAPGNPGQPLLREVSADNPLVTEQWSLTLTEVSPARDWFAFRVAGTVTGLDGAGRSDQPFASRSGRVKIAPTNWVELTQLAQLDFLAPGHSFSWEVRELFQEFITNAPAGTVVTVADDLRCGLHILELEPLDGDEIPVSEVRILNDRNARCSLGRSFVPRHFLARYVAYRDHGSPATAFEIPARGAVWPLYLHHSEESGSFFSVAASDRIIASFQLPYYANYSLPGGWTLRFYDASGTNGTPGILLFDMSGDIRPQGDMIDINFAFNTDNEVSAPMFYTVEFKGTGNDNYAGLLVSEGEPSPGDASSDHWHRSENTEWRWGYIPFTYPYQLPWEPRPGLQWRHAATESRLKFRQSPYTRHRLEATSSLTAPDWLPLGDLTVDADGLLEWQPPVPDSSPRFYRTVPLP